MTKPSVAIIGTGAGGMACGYFLHNKFNVTLYEQNDYVGGHANTAIIEESDETVYTDTAFVIFNEENYPLFSRLLNELEVKSIACPMGFSFKILPTGWEYNTKGLSWIPTNLKNLLDRRFFKLLKETGKFYRQATEIFNDKRYHEYSIAQYVTEKGYSDDFLHYYLIPIIAVVWSIPPRDMLDYPALTMIDFLKNHGAFQGIFGSKRWRTVKGGSRCYRDKLIAPFKDRILLENRVTTISRINGKAQITDSNAEQREFDHVIVACHADQALQLLSDATPLEKKLLGSFRYSKNHVLLHTDVSIMPEKRSLWAGWNYLVEQDSDGQAISSFSYHMNNLQKVSKKKDYFVTVNDTGRVDPGKILREYDYEHPIFDLTTANAQLGLHGLNENGVTFYCGSYFRYGFHEDAVRSGIDVCRTLTGERIWGD